MRKKRTQLILEEHKHLHILVLPESRPLGHGKVQHRNSAMYGLPTTLRILRVNCNKSDWLRIRKDCPAHAPKIGPSQRSWFLVWLKIMAHAQHLRACAFLFVSLLPRKLRMVERVVHRYKGQANIYTLLSTVADNQLRVQAKAKHEMLANLVLPAFIDELPRTRERRIERRNTFTFQAPSMRTKKDGMYPPWFAAYSTLLRYRERGTHES